MKDLIDTVLEQVNVGGCIVFCSRRSDAISSW